MHARTGSPPTGVEDLECGDGSPPDRDALVAAGQALTWQSPFTLGSVLAVPLTRASAVTFDHPELAGVDRWHDRFLRGFAHRMAIELTIASVTAELVGETAEAQPGEDVRMLGSAITGLGQLLKDLGVVRRPEECKSMIVADTMRTHDVLLGGLGSQEVSLRRRGAFAVHTVRSVPQRPERCDLDVARAQVGLPWPTRVGGGIGEDLGLARWRTTMQALGHQVWSRLEERDALVTELWLRDLAEAPG
ncbi:MULTISPECIES: hypothetical protein [unclassified Spirillospora]|uniref:hypothetical protein n=1 Tax=unclassified Spirillospora TaxID=2642701 RepID=UPI00371E9D03